MVQTSRIAHTVVRGYRFVNEQTECIWELDESDDVYYTSCSNAFIINEGTPTENAFKYCIYCGKRLIEYDSSS